MFLRVSLDDPATNQAEIVQFCLSVFFLDVNILVSNTVCYSSILYRLLFIVITRLLLWFLWIKFEAIGRLIGLWSFGVTTHKH